MNRVSRQLPLIRFKQNDLDPPFSFNLNPTRVRYIINALLSFVLYFPGVKLGLFPRRAGYR